MKMTKNEGRNNVQEKKKKKAEKGYWVHGINKSVWHFTVISLMITSSKYGQNSRSR